jgi:hypothetical protein
MSRDLNPVARPRVVSRMSGVYADLQTRLPSTSARWATDEFRAELSDWVGGHVGPPTAMESVRLRPWSTVWRVEAPAGVHFAKQNTPLQAFEARLAATLVALAPGHVVPVTAADPDRDLLLTPDQGRVLGEVLGESAEDVDTVSRVMRQAAELQRALVPHVDALAAAGLTAITPADALPYVQQRLDEIAALAPDDPRSFAPGAAERLEAALPSLASAVERVASLGLPVTLNHNDLHPHNVFETDGRMRFFDFGDAVLAEPLGALRGPLAGLAHRLGCAIDDPRLRRAVEPALEVWSDLAPLSELRAALPSALRLDRLARCESWIRCSASMTDDELGEFGEAGTYWLAAAADD